MTVDDATAGVTVEAHELAWAEALLADETPAPAPPRTDDPAERGTTGSLYDTVASAHDAALAAQAALAARLLRTPSAPIPTRTPPVVAPPERRVWSPRRTAFTPLAGTDREQLGSADLVALTRGDLAAALGAPYAQPGQNPRLALAAGRTLLLTGVSRLDQRGGRVRGGTLEATCAAPGDDHLTAAHQAVEVMALLQGLALCFADCTLAGGTPPGDPAAGGGTPTVVPGTGRPATTVQVEVVSVDLVPLPWLAADVRLLDADGEVAACVDGLAVHAAPRPGLPLGPEVGGTVPQFLGRFNRDGVPAMLSEFNIAHIAHGDQALAMGPEFGRFSDTPAVRLPSGELLLVDRVMDVTGQRGEPNGPARWRTEYDSPADAWYYRDSANAGMPNCVFMEFSLQAAAFLGPYLGGTLLGGADEPVLLRNLEGRATLLRDVDLRGRLISQEASITATSVTPGAVLQEFAYESSLDGEPFYRGRSLFGYFGPEALANQTGLDGGVPVPTWLEANPTATPRTLDVARRRAAPGRMACSTGRLALLDHVDVVDGGGRAGLGYLHAVQDIDPAAWYFHDHFRLDPVIPGSFGVETLIQAVQEWAVDAGLDDGLDAPEFVLPVDSTLIWKYRGQFLRTDTPMVFEVHVTGVERRPGRVRVRAEGSVWKPGMRIYWVEQMVVELREPGAPPW